MNAILLLFVFGALLVSAVQVSNQAELAPALIETEATADCVTGCTTSTTNTPCVYSAWSTWSSCGVTCIVAGGSTPTQKRTRTILTQAVGTGTACSTTQLTGLKACSLPACPINCKWGAWYQTSYCEKSCGEEYYNQHRDKATLAKNGGLECVGPSDQEVSCGHDDCPAECTWITEADAYWDTCDQECGGGFQLGLLFSVDTEGNICEMREVVQDCNTEVCPVPCSWGAWSAWSACDKACGGGAQERSRAVAVAAQGTGPDCEGPVQDRQNCNTEVCAVDCGVDSWSQWSACGVSCVQAYSDAVPQQTRTRSIVTPPVGGGAACPNTQEHRGCPADQTPLCPVDCVMDIWSEWTDCTVPCGPLGGTQDRSRKILVREANGGIPCGSEMDSQSCNVRGCPIDCETGPWSLWSRCSANCGGGQTSRTRDVLTYARFGGVSCPNLAEIEPCNPQPCPEACKTGAWSSWSSCSQTCTLDGGHSGTQKRTRTVLSNAVNGGAGCGCTEQIQYCNFNYCPIDCVVSSMVATTDCSSTCGAGSFWQEASVLVPPRFGGKDCPVLFEKVACGTECCPVDCVVDEWTAFSACDKPCGGGKKTRTRTVLQASLCSGRPCPAITETIDCNAQDCPVDCVIGAWTLSGPECSAPCGKGLTYFSTTVVTPAKAGGKPCPALVRSEPCTGPPCPHDCKYGPWSGYSACVNSDNIVVSCGGGTQTRVKPVVQQPVPADATCVDKHETRNCAVAECRIDCEVSAWSNWDTCSQSCGGGFQSRVSTITVQPQFGGRRCPTLNQVQICNTQVCPTHCVVSDWSSWSPCSAPCDAFPNGVSTPGYQEQWRFVLVDAANGGVACPKLSDSRQCNIIRCPVDCIVSAWSSPSPCSAACGEGTITLTRSIQVQDAFGGKQCPTLTSTYACTAPPCNPECFVSDWTPFGPCSVTCNGGTQTRTRYITQFPKNGTPCPFSLEESQECGATPCPIPCVFTEWSGWSACSADGIKRRTRHIATAPQFGGTECAKCTVERDECNPPVNPQECDLQPCATASYY